MKHLPDQPWFPVFDLACASAAILLLEIFPGMGGWPLLVGFVPWIVRLADGKAPFRHTPFDIPLAFFLATAAVGVWAASQPQAAWAKFWLIAAGILLYFAIASQPPRSLWIFCALFGLVGVAVAIFFLLTHGWASAPAKLGFLDQWMLAWIKIRPALPLVQFYPNAAGGIMALTAPFLVAFAIRTWKSARLIVRILLAAAIALVTAAIFITVSRGAWIALAVALIFLGLVGAGRALAKRVRLNWKMLLVAAGCIFVAALVWGVLVHPDWIIRAANLLPGPQSAESRYDLNRDALNLIRDYPYTGSGLDSFPGQYSIYVQVVSDYILPYSHNIFLDAAIEQGILGSLALIILFAGTLWLLLTVRAEAGTPLLGWACLASLLVLIIHGFSDNIVYYQGGTPLLLIIPAISAAIIHAGDRRRLALRGNRWCGGMLILFAAAALLGVLLIRPLKAAWYADLGAVKMAKIQLAGFPRPYSLLEAPDFTAEELLFQKALQLDPRNATASYRVGIIALSRQDYPGAIAYLQAAFRAEPQNRGILKNLGLAYTWDGDLAAGQPLLSQVPEAEGEMQTYIWWWSAHGRNDLAAFAGKMAEKLASPSTP